MNRPSVPTTGVCRFHGPSPHRGSVLAIAMHGQYAVTAGYDQTIKLWKASSGQLLNSIQAHNHIISSLDVSSNGTIVSGSWDKSVKLWRLHNGKLLHVLEGHTNRVRCVKAMEDMVASGGDDNRVIVWDRASGAQLVSLGLGAGSGVLIGIGFLAGHLVAVSSEGLRAWGLHPLGSASDAWDSALPRGCSAMACATMSRRQWQWMKAVALAALGGGTAVSEEDDEEEDEEVHVLAWAEEGTLCLHPLGGAASLRLAVCGEGAGIKIIGLLHCFGGAAGLLCLVETGQLAVLRWDCYTSSGVTSIDLKAPSTSSAVAVLAKNPSRRSLSRTPSAVLDVEDACWHCLGGAAVSDCLCLGGADGMLLSLTFALPPLAPSLPAVTATAIVPLSRSSTSTSVTTIASADSTTCSDATEEVTTAASVSPAVAGNSRAGSFSWAALDEAQFSFQRARLQALATTRAADMAAGPRGGKVRREQQQKQRSLRPVFS